MTRRLGVGIVEAVSAASVHTGFSTAVRGRQAFDRLPAASQPLPRCGLDSDATCSDGRVCLPSSRAVSTVHWWVLTSVRRALSWT